MNYLCTKSGYEFTAQFAKKGDEIGVVVFTEDGKYSDQVYEFGELKETFASGGLTTYQLKTNLEGEDYVVIEIESI